MRNTTVGGVVGVALLFGLGACDGGGGPAETVTKLIGPAGGVVALSDGAKVDIPAGALSEARSIKITKLEPEGVTLPDNLEAAGRPYKFEPHGTTFARDIKITLPYVHAEDDEPLSVRPIKAPSEDGPWTTIVGSEKDVAKQELSFDVRSFSVMRAARPRRTGVVTLPDGAIEMDGAAGSGGSIADAGVDAALPDATVPDAALVDTGVVDAGQEPLVPLVCPVVTPLRVVFPPSGAATDQQNLTVRVQTQPGVDLDSLEIAGVVAAQQSDPTMWTADVALVSGTQELIAIGRDTTSVEVARATVSVTRLPLQLPVVHTAAAGPTDILYAFVDGSHELVEINLTTDARRVIASTEIGTGASLWNASYLAYAPTRGSVVLAYNGVLVEIDLTTGDRVEVPRGVGGSDASPGEITGLAVSGNTAFIVTQATTTTGMLTGAALLSVQLDTGVVAIVSGLGQGTGTALRDAAGLALSDDGNTAYLLDVAEQGAQEPARIFTVNVTTGARSLIAEEGDANGVDFPNPDDLLLTADGDLWIASRNDLIRRDISGARELAFERALPQPNGYTMRLSRTPSGAQIAVPDQRLDVIALVNLVDGTQTTIGREPVGPVRLDEQPHSIAAGGGRLFVNGTFDSRRQLHALCEQNLAHHVLAGERHPVIGAGIGYMAFDSDAQEIIVQGDQLAAIRVTDRATRVVHEGPLARGRSEVHNGILYVADPQTAMAASYDLSTGQERILGSATVGTGPAFNAPTGALYDGARNRVFAVDYLEGVMALDLTTLVRTIFVPNIGGSEALPYPRHMYVRPFADEARIHPDGDLGYMAVDLATGMSSRVWPTSRVQRIGSIGESAYDADLDLLWVFPSGWRSTVYVIDVATQNAVIAIQ